MTTMPKKFWVVCITCDKKKYIMLNDDYKVMAFGKKKNAHKYFEQSYEAAHHRSYEGSMSACVHFIMFQPEVVGPVDIDQIKEAVGTGSQAYSLMSPAGAMNGMLLEKPLPGKSQTVNIAAGCEASA